MKKEMFCENLKEIREFLGYSQGELAKMSSLTPAAISNFEAGRRLPSLTTVIKISNALCVSLDRLVFKKD